MSETSPSGPAAVPPEPPPRVIVVPEMADVERKYRNAERAERLRQLNEQLVNTRTLARTRLLTLLSENAHNCDPPLAEKEVREIVGELGLHRPGASNYDDTWIKEQFIDLHRSELRFIPEIDDWFAFDSSRWARDRARSFEDRAQGMFTKFRLDGEVWHDKKMMKAGDAKNLAAKVKSVIFLARSSKRMQASFQQFDRNRMLFNVANGTIDLRTGELRPHDRDDFITKLSPIEFDPAAACPLFDRFLAEVFPDDPETVAYMWRVIGYCLTGETREDCYFQFYGYGANGKSTLINVLEGLLGEYAETAKIQTFTVGRDRGAADASPDLARLRGARLVHAAEARKAAKLDESIIKQWTGGDAVAARHLYQEEFTFKPECKIVITSNSKPVVHDGSDGFWRRVRLIEFPARFEGAAKDVELARKLRTELPGILAAAVRGCLEWQRLGRLCEPAAVSQATEAYRREENVIERFLEECTVREDHSSVRMGELFESYRSFCKMSGDEPEGRGTFGAALTRLGFWSARPGGTSVRMGLRLRRVTDEPADSAKESDDAGF